MSQVKEHLIRELKELLGIALYLAASFSLLATGKALILIQIGIHDFAHGYLKALIEAMALCKIVLLAQRIPVLNALDSKSLLVSSIFKAAIMAVIVFMGGQVEEKIFAKDVAQATLKHEVAISTAHLAALLAVFYVLFLARGLDKSLGQGRLLKLLTEPHPKESN